MATILHGILQALLAELLRRQGIYAGSEISLRMSPTKILIPDVVAMKVLETPYPTKPVELCCEILSPGDSLGATFAKCEEYQAWGVPYCWVIDPEKRTTWEYHKDGEPTRITETLRAGELAIDLAELFSALPTA